MPIIRTLTTGLVALSLGAWWCEAQDVTAPDANISIDRIGRPIVPDAPRVAVTAALHDFANWTRAYLAHRTADPAGPPGMSPSVSDGAVLAANRQAMLFELIRDDPAEALSMALPPSVARQLPAAVSQYLEAYVNGPGTFVVTVGCGPNGSAVFRQVAYQGKVYDAYVSAAGSPQTSRRNIVVTGIAVGSRMALHAGSLLAGETADADGSNPTRLDDVVIGGDSGARRPWTTGAKSVLYMRLDYPDAPGATLSLTGAQQLMAQASDFYAANTYGRIPSLSYTVTPTLRMPKLYAAYTSRDEVEQDATTVGIASGFDPAAYDLVVYQNTPQQVMSGFWGFARENAKGVWMYNGFNWMHHSHEFGHNFGNRHANLWDTFGKDPIGPGTNLEYGDVFDNMGNQGNLGTGHHHPWFKNRQDWIDDSYITTVTSSGTYRVQALESAPNSNWMALRIPRDADRNYWVFYRNQFIQSENAAILTWGYNQRVSAHLLDMTPGSATGINDSWDAPLPIGQSFLDVPANIQITPIARAGGDAGSLDIQVTLGPPNNVSPIVDAGVSRIVTITGPSITINLDGTVIDPDNAPETVWAGEGAVTFGNPLAVDTTATFSAPGFYALALVANDLVNPPITDDLSIGVVAPGTEALLLTSPAGGDTWTEQMPATITWESATIANVAVELSRDGGNTWAPLAGAVAASAGSWTWSAVTGPASNRCLIRISDATDGSPMHQLPDFFTIASGVCVPAIPGDLDCDGDVDLNDYALLGPCLGGPIGTTAPPGCDPLVFANADLDADGDSDLIDAAQFAVNFGAATP